MVTVLRPINYGPSAEDIYISASQIRRFSLRNGDKVAGKARPPKESERYYGLMHVESVNGKDPEEAKNVAFSSLNTSLSAKTASTGNNTAKTIYPNDRYLSPIGLVSVD